MVKSGYAIAVEEDLLSPTVAHTPRAAMVNWLYAFRNYVIVHTASNESIRKNFIREAKKCNARLVKVTIIDDRDVVCDPETIDLLKGC